MNYTSEDFKLDLLNPEMLHIKDKKRFIAFYEELGKLPIQKKQQVRSRIKFIEPIGDILELGCHAGFNLVYFASKGFNVTGVDISSSLLEEAKRRRSLLSQEIADRITLIHSDILDLVVYRKFDTVILTETLEHVIEPFMILKKSIDFMRPTSKIYVSAPNKRIGNYSHVRGITEKWMRLAGADLGVVFEFISTSTETRAIGVLK